jgi:hypothetical protein
MKKMNTDKSYKTTHDDDDTHTEKIKDTIDSSSLKSSIPTKKSNKTVSYDELRNIVEIKNQNRMNCDYTPSDTENKTVVQQKNKIPHNNNSIELKTDKKNKEQKNRIPLNPINNDSSAYDKIIHEYEKDISNKKDIEQQNIIPTTPINNDSSTYNRIMNEYEKDISKIKQFDKSEKSRYSKYIQDIKEDAEDKPNKEESNTNDKKSESRFQWLKSLLWLK